MKNNRAMNKVNCWLMAAIIIGASVFHTSLVEAQDGCVPSDEICDGIDNNCDEVVDEGCDDDNDDYCDANMTVVDIPDACPNGGGDCDDEVAAVNPGATEVCDGIDNNCVDGIDEGGDMLCDDNNPCTADSCEGTSFCFNDSEPMNGVVCRDSAGVCDIAETCQDGECPADGKSTAECRSSAGACDMAEFCDGAGNDCPADGYLPDTEVCRAAAGPCDLAESCTGSSADCPIDAKSTAECRSSARTCDAAEFCDGESNDCPVDNYQPDNTPCDNETVCDGREVCTAGECMAGTPLECSDDGNICNGGESCDPIDGCVSTDPLPDGTSCDNETICDGREVCSAGECLAGTPLECEDDGNICNGGESCDPIDGCVSTDSLPDGASCDNETVCDGREVCYAEECMAGMPLECEDDDNICNGEEVCDPIDGCVSTGPPLDGTPCEDGDDCTIDDFCSAGICLSGIDECNDPPDCSNAMPRISSIKPPNHNIWPPNHKMVEVGIEGITDPNGDSVTVTITKITQDEPVNADGDGNTHPDGDAVGTGTARVRAERAGSGNSRVYEISFTADDGHGGECDGSVQVCVPHDNKGKNSSCIDDGQDYISTDWYEIDVDIDMSKDPIKVCFTPEVNLNADPIITLVTGNGSLDPPSGSTVSPVDDHCSGSTYCVEYTPADDDEKVEIWFEEDSNDPVYPGFLGFQVANFKINSDHDHASSFCVYSVTSCRGFMRGEQCDKDDVIFDVDVDDLDLTGAKDEDGNPLRGIDCIPARIVDIEVSSIPKKVPNKKVTKLYDINLYDGVTIASGKSVTITIGFKLTEGSKHDFDKGKKAFEVYYYNEMAGNWESRGIRIIDVQWDSDTSGTITFTSTHLTTFAASSKQTSQSGDVSNTTDTESTSAAGTGCSLTSTNHKMFTGSAIANTLIFLLPLVVFGISRKKNKKDHEN